MKGMSRPLALSLAVLAVLAAGASAAPYSFENDNGESTVGFSDQTAALDKADALYEALNSPDTTQDDLSSMLGGEDGIGSRAGAGCANNVGDGGAATQARLEELATDFADNVAPAWESEAANGSPGFLSDDSRTLNVNSQGWELDQVFIKSLIGSFTLDQIANHYLASCTLDDGSNAEDNCNGVTQDGETHTAMEHAWDQAYGLLYGQAADPASDSLGSDPGGDGTTLNKYLKKASEGDVTPGIAQSIHDAFVKGRQAISDCDYETRDAQAQIIQQDLSKVVGSMVDNYLQQYLEKRAAGLPADAVHALSEGYGFMASLPYTNDGSGNPYFTQAQVEGYLSQLDNFWTVDEAQVNSILSDIDSAYGFRAVERELEPEPVPQPEPQPEPVAAEAEAPEPFNFPTFPEAGGGGFGGIELQDEPESDDPEPASFPAFGGGGGSAPAPAPPPSSDGDSGGDGDSGAPPPPADGDSGGDGDSGAPPPPSDGDSGAPTDGDSG
jgi:hypothetical protein